MRLLRLQEVKRATGLSRSTIYADPEFPRPVKISPRAVAWLEAEVSDWVNAKIAARDAG